MNALQFPLPSGIKTPQSPSAKQTKIMLAQFKKATKEKNEYIKFCIDPNNPLVWYIKLHSFAGNEDEFAGAEYLVTMIAPEDFPYNPPSFYIHTPNGVYGVDQKVCINIGEYHKDQYRASLGMAGFANQLISGLVGWRDLGGGINIKNTKLEEKRKLSKDTIEYNKKSYLPEMNQLIESTYESYSSNYTR